MPDKRMPESTESIPALKVHQWLEAWNDLAFDAEQNQTRPQEHFYLFSLSASTLRSLAGIYRRSTSDATSRKEDLGIQRRHDPARSQEIHRYIDGGYPWSSLSATKRSNPEHEALKKPGWLPAAVVVNLLTEEDVRVGKRVRDDELITVVDQPDGATAVLNLPTRPGNSNFEVPPIEIIDGQHRLFAFDDADPQLEEYQLPVVAFRGLDISWQAYLFWTINIKPKRINASLAFDLYPLLREEKWLDSGESVHVYRESRAQELTEVLWSTPASPWYRRINMLGGSRKENGPVTQAAFIRGLAASLVKPWQSSKGPGGVFGGSPKRDAGLGWTRLQQSAFLLTAWQELAARVEKSSAAWAESLREASNELPGMNDLPGLWQDPAFSGPYTLLASDQGVRGFQYVLNDLCYVQHRKLGLSSWRDSEGFADVSPESVEVAADSLRDQPVFQFLQELCLALAEFDWRSSTAPGLSEDERQRAAALRGSGGYKELRLRLTRFLAESSCESIAVAAKNVLETL